MSTSVVFLRWALGLSLCLGLATSSVLLSGCKDQVIQPPVMSQMRAYSETARRCVRDADCVVGYPLVSCCWLCLRVPRAWNREAYLRIARASSTFCEGKRRACGKASCGATKQDVLSRLDLFVRCEQGRCRLRYRKGPPPAKRRYPYWDHPAMTKQQTGPSVVQKPPPMEEPSPEVLACLHAILAGQQRPDLDSLVEVPVHTVLAMFSALVEGQPLALRGRVSIPKEVLLTPAALSHIHRVAPRGFLLRFGRHQMIWIAVPGDRPLPRRGQWVTVRGRVAMNADAAMPLYREPPPNQKRIMPYQAPEELTYLADARWKATPAPPEAPKGWN